MATDTSVNSTSNRRSQSGGAVDFARAIVQPLASLKLTVFLLVVATIVVWIATLDQTRIDIWELKDKHFRSFLVYVPFQTLFPPAWFANMQDIPGGFYIPSGITLITCMLINLSSAHLLRFRVQASGARLVAGILVGLFCAAVTWMISFGGIGEDGFQRQLVSYKSLWTSLQVGLLGLSVASVAACFLMSNSKRVERLVMAVMGFIGFCVLGFIVYTGEAAFIGDSAMRILWQLIQASIAAVLGLAAGLLIFRRKAGIVLLHLGIAGLLLNEVYVTVTNEEQQMQIVEGTTSSEAVDIRAIEMAVIDRSDEKFDNVVTIPSSILRTKEVINNDDLPFQIECLDYFINSDLIDVKPDSKPRATAGLGLSVEAVEKPQVPGADADKETDMPSAYVRLLKKSDQSEIGVYLVGLVPYRSDFIDTVSVDGKDYQIGLRFKHVYKPYSITLNDVSSESYLGTNIPKSYASDIVLQDHERDTSTTLNVWMNNPLRYGGETFYQSGYDNDGRTETTVLQIVKNRGWMIPYLCCMFVVVGLMYQFGITLLKFLGRERKQQTAAKVSWIPAMVLVLIFGGYATGQMAKSMRGTDINDGMRLELLGQIPVTNGGRVQPLDSVARNLARQLGNRETVVHRKDKQSAMRWLADTLFEREGFAEDYEFLRIEDLAVLQALSLPQRKRFKYSWAELQASEDELLRLLRESAKLPEEERTPLHKRLNEVYSKMARVVELKRALTDPASYSDSTSLLQRLENAAQASKLSGIPLAVATTNPDEPWLSLSSAISRDWLNDLAEEYGERNVDQLVAKIVDKLMIEPARKEVERDELIKSLLDDEDDFAKLKELTGEKLKSQILVKLNEAAFLESLPDDLTADNLQAVRTALEPRIEQGRQIFETDMARNVRLINGEKNSEIQPTGAIGLEHLIKVGPAYIAGDADTFNTSLESYLSEIHETPPTGMRSLGVKVESFYNRFSPFYQAMVVYLVAFVISVLGWGIWSGPMRKAAYWLVILGLVIHFGGIVARVVISGRPPVTNLYSSFVFVSAAGMLFVLGAERMTKLGVGTLMASKLGFLPLLWAWTMSISDGDTFTVLQAVLDTQFWLSTHVVCISLGYCATIAAGFLGIAMVLGAMFTKAFDNEKRRRFTNSIYGVICFGLLFSFFGTVLGGLWADDSWGRFWGWDPKENGALMIVLWNAVILHARWAGLVRDRGVAVLAIIGNIVTVWSWEAVNQMGVGLHAYGGSEGNRMMYVAYFWLANIAIIAIAMVPTKFWRSYKS